MTWREINGAVCSSASCFACLANLLGEVATCSFFDAFADGVLLLYWEGNVEGLLAFSGAGLLFVAWLEGVVINVEGDVCRGSNAACCCGCITPTGIRRELGVIVALCAC